MALGEWEKIIAVADASFLKGLVAEIRSLMEALQEHGFRLSRVLIETVLREAGEL